MTDIRPPAELAWLTDVIGPEAALVVIETFGGTRMRVPLRADRPTVLSEAVGMAAQAKLVAAFGGDRIRVPLCKWWRARIYRWERRMSVPQIARRLGMVEGAVQSLLRSSRPGPQLGMGPAARTAPVSAQMALPLSEDG